MTDSRHKTAEMYLAEARMVLGSTDLEEAAGLSPADRSGASSAVGVAVLLALVDVADAVRELRDEITGVAPSWHEKLANRDDPNV